ncbi:MAG TPA: hypothetical protein VH189_15820, partial [Rhizomicrobium sp.]|nr:hypothetical protein [Rhizomicrobium sp.]
VGFYITGAYWFTASTSFANPAVTMARMLSDSFAGIAPSSVPGFIAAQLAATLAACFALPWLFASPSETKAARTDFSETRQSETCGPRNAQP